MHSDLLTLKPWLHDHVKTMLSPWVLDLLIFSSKDIVKAAALVGSQMADQILLGQVSHEHDARIVNVGIKTPTVARALRDFGNDCYMSSTASILRTAIMIGLSLPQVGRGVMSCTRSEPISREESLVIISRAESLFPMEYK